MTTDTDQHRALSAALTAAGEALDLGAIGTEPSTHAQAREAMERLWQLWKEAEPPTAWLVMRWQEGPASHGRTAWLADGPTAQGWWSRVRSDARTMPQAEAERLAEDWTSHARQKGRPEAYRAEPVNGGPADAPQA